ncbi:inositol monophosphatase family protein [Candidatus Aenigmatarchaeota archaeon]
MSEFLKVATEAARNAEKVIINYFNQPIGFEMKSDMTPVTIADKESEKAIIETIQKSFPDHSFLGEESGSSGDSEYKWIIDPIDGTKSFTRKLPFFNTEIALMKDNEIILGISNAPILREIMYAEKGKGTFINGQKVHMGNTNKLNMATVFHGRLMGFKNKGSLPNITELLLKTYDHKCIGDCNPYHFVASGRADAMIEAKVKIWDIAAVSICMTEAGGVVSDMKGDPINLNTESIISSNKELYDKILAYFK